MRPAEKTGCTRCGSCCTHQSPSLHFQDVKLIRSGLLQPSQLYTLRRGERVFDNIEGKNKTLEKELIKIKEKPKSSSCIFYDQISSACSIYSQRPLQCRVFQCWNTQPLLELFKEQKPTRRDIIKDKDLLEIINYHDQRVSPERFHGLITEEIPSKRDTELLEMINFDLYFREFISEKLGLQKEELDFYFGRSLIQCIRPYGYVIRGSQKEGYVIEASKR